MIYLVYGTQQELLLNNEIKKIIKNIDKNMDELSSSTYFLDETPIETVIDDCSTPSFFVENKVIIARNAFFFQNTRPKVKVNHNLEILEKYLDNPADFTTLIFVCNGNVDEKKPLVKKLKDHSSFIKINDVDKDDWPAVINQLIGQYKLDFDYEARKEFIDRVVYDLTNITNELRKLKIYGGKITLDVVKTMVAPKLEDRMFELVDSILANDINKSLKIYYDLKQLNEDPTRLVSTLGTQFRFLYQVAYLRDQGLSNDEIAKEFTNVKSGRIYFTLKKMNNRTLADILNIQDELASLDQKIKTSEIDKFRGFELFLVKEH